MRREKDSRHFRERETARKNEPKKSKNPTKKPNPLQKHEIELLSFHTYRQRKKNECFCFKKKHEQLCWEEEEL